jgi:hypothetical protein
VLFVIWYYYLLLILIYLFFPCGFLPWFFCFIACHFFVFWFSFVIDSLFFIYYYFSFQFSCFHCVISVDSMLTSSRDFLSKLVVKVVPVQRLCTQKMYRCLCSWNIYSRKRSVTRVNECRQWKYERRNREQSALVAISDISTRTVLNTNGREFSSCDDVCD